MFGHPVRVWKCLTDYYGEDLERVYTAPAAEWAEKLFRYNYALPADATVVVERI